MAVKKIDLSGNINKSSLIATLLILLRNYENSAVKGGSKTSLLAYSKKIVRLNFDYDINNEASIVLHLSSFFLNLNNKFSDIIKTVK